jgi:hypothetical protein
VSLSFATAQISELVGLVAIGLVGQPVGFGLVWFGLDLLLVWFDLVCTLWSYWFDLTIMGNHLGVSRLSSSSLIRGRVTFAIRDAYLASCPRPDRMCVTVCLPALG